MSAPTITLPSIGASVLYLVAAIAVLASALTAGGAYYRHQQQVQCEEKGHVWSPIRPDGDLFQCWVQDAPQSPTT